MADSTPPAGAESRIAAPAEPAAETPATLDETNPAALDKPPPSEPARPPRAPPPPGAAAEDRLGQAPSSPPDRFAVAGWVMTVLVLGLAAYAGYAFRAEIMAAWPPSQRLYALLGLV